MAYFWKNNVQHLPNTNINFDWGTASSHMCGQIGHPQWGPMIDERHLPVCKRCLKAALKEFGEA